MEVVSYMKDGSVDNWDLFEKVLDYAYSKVNTILSCDKIIISILFMSVLNSR